MMETRVFAVLSAAEGGMALCLTPIEPDITSPGIVAVLRTVGTLEGPITIHLPGANILPQD